MDLTIENWKIIHPSNHLALFFLYPGCFHFHKLTYWGSGSTYDFRCTLLLQQHFNSFPAAYLLPIDVNYPSLLLIFSLLTSTPSLLLIFSLLTSTPSLLLIFSLLTSTPSLLLIFSLLNPNYASRGRSYCLLYGVTSSGTSWASSNELSTVAAKKWKSHSGKRSL